MDVDNIWNEFLLKIKENTNSMIYETWFMDTKLLSLENDLAKILVPMHVHKKFTFIILYFFVNHGIVFIYCS